jgi:erythromycin esterase-like protein
MDELDSTGRLVAKDFGKNVYALGVVARTGRWSWRGGDPIDYTPAKPGSLEAMLKPHVAPLGFVDLRGLPPVHPLWGPFPAAMDRQNHFELSTVWPDGFDGLLYIDEMQPRAQLPSNTLSSAHHQ